MKTKGTYYLCKYCKTLEFIPEGEFGIKTEQLTAVYCPKCICKDHKRKMVKVEE